MLIYDTCLFSVKHMKMWAPDKRESLEISLLTAVYIAYLGHMCQNLERQGFAGCPADPEKGKAVNIHGWAVNVQHISDDFCHFIDLSYMPFMFSLHLTPPQWQRTCCPSLHLLDFIFHREKSWNFLPTPYYNRACKNLSLFICKSFVVVKWTFLKYLSP